MTFQEAITAQAVHSGQTLPRASNHDKPELRIQRMIRKGWVAGDGRSLTPLGREMVAAYGEREGWNPVTISALRTEAT